MPKKSVSHPSIIRVKKETNYSVIANEPLTDRRLSWGARGLLAYLLSKPDNWTVITSHLVRESPAGREATQTIINELKAAGYLVRLQRQDPETGKFQWETTVYERPAKPGSTINGFSVDGPPVPGSPVDGKPVDIVSTESPRTESQSTETKKTEKGEEGNPPPPGDKANSNRRPKKQVVVDSPSPPLPSSDLSPKVIQSLKEIGVWEKFWPEVAQSGRTENEVLQLIAWSELEGDNPAALFKYRLENDLYPLADYYHGERDEDYDELDGLLYGEFYSGGKKPPVRLRRLQEEFHEEWILEAYQIALKKKAQDKLDQMESILKSWRDRGRAERS